jgi:hypothetical protein
MASPTLRLNPDSLKPINVICPVQSLQKKYSASQPTQITGLSQSSRLSRGALAIVANVGTGCGGRGSVGRAGAVAGRFSVSDRDAQTNDVASGFTSASPTELGKTVNSPMTVTRRIRRRGERGISR